ncbi:hypothetical protein D6833_01160, partial [Candidatus Parcubacteria bacterium]
MAANNDFWRRYKPSSESVPCLWGDAVLGEDVATGRSVLITRLSSQLGSPSKFIANLHEMLIHLGETKAIPHLAKLLYVGEQDGVAVWVQDVGIARSLSSLLEESSPLPIGLVIAIAQQIGECLDALHTRSLPHGGLCPESVMLPETGEILVLDAGVALAVDLPALLQAGAMPLASWHAPEIRSGQALSPQADVYALGALVYTLLTGETPALDADSHYPADVT